MLIHQFTQRGTSHQNHCEDYSLFAEIGTNRLLMAVMDGCTMGTESYFASALLGKMLRKIAYEEFYLSYATAQHKLLNVLLVQVFRQLFDSLKNYAAELHLDRYEMLSTLLVAIVDLTESATVVQVIGDGVVYHNGDLVIFDQENVPDYMAYHLQEDFDDWFAKQNQYLKLMNTETLSISSDGVLTFTPFDTASYPRLNEDELLHLLFSDREGLSNERFFWKKTRYIEEKYGLKPLDDLGIVRLDLV